MPNLASGRWAVCLALVCGLTSIAAAEPRDPINKRFAAAEGEETPSFQRHVLPLMGRLGCNGRACHGSFQGQGGFRLSLFGFDFNAAPGAPELSIDKLAVHQVV